MCFEFGFEDGEDGSEFQTWGAEQWREEDLKERDGMLSTCCC